MSGVHKDVILEALSALTGTSLKHHTDVNDMTSAIEVDIFSLISNAITRGGLAVKSPSPSVSRQEVPKPRLLGGAREYSEDLHREYFVNIENLLDPRFDYDLTDLEDDKLCYERGGEQYNRPYGWNRIALRVLNKYPDGNVWLGLNKLRTDSAVGEWPVSYHGTTIKGATGITETHYTAGKGIKHGRGIYSTPHAEEAATFSDPFQFTPTGKFYEVLLQNRINPQMRTVCEVDDYWLIEIPHDTPPDEAKRIVEKSIRPYGILLKQL